MYNDVFKLLMGYSASRLIAKYFCFVTLVCKNDSFLIWIRPPLEAFTLFERGHFKRRPNYSWCPGTKEWNDVFNNARIYSLLCVRPCSEQYPRQLKLGCSPLPDICTCPILW
ncbi:hypothetical protein CDAR_600141 [Caerostris darwini]|uniref:Uncharacterized protein n=1 Tax=Caerostris darwini TaxID=1538125 RepID=A0AAV4RWR4_9ARAC|nr:hypothetical protein CDAR_600141 [Caerostris darwini]